MAITTRCRRSGSRSFRIGFVRTAVRTGARIASAKSALPLVFALAVCPATAQQWMLDTGVSSQVTWTSDTALGSATGVESDDTAIELRPRFAIRREGARLRISGSAAFTGTTYLNGTQPSRVLPVADLNAHLEAVERWFYVEGSARALQTRANPFGASTGSASTANTLTTTQLRLSPYIESRPAPNWRYRLRSDNTKTSDAGSTFSVSASNASGYFGRHSLLVERDPRPFGARFEVERSDTRYDDSPDRLILDVARLTTDYAFSDEFSAGLRGGYERNNFSSDEKGPIYGVQARWRPSERTEIEAFREKRFFGTGWRFGFDHRTPLVAWNIALRRGIDTAPQALFELPATDNVAGLLDAIFTTRHPDPVERARVVQDFIAQRGLPAATLGPTNIYTQRISVVNSRSASITLIGSRNTITLSGFNTRTEDAATLSLAPVNSELSNNIQYGAGLEFSRRTSATGSLTAGLDWSRIRALVTAARTDETGVRLRYTLQLAPRTSTFIGMRYRVLDSSVAADGEEGAVFVGLDQRF